MVDYWTLKYGVHGCAVLYMLINTNKLGSGICGHTVPYLPGLASLTTRYLGRSG